MSAPIKLNFKIYQGSTFREMFRWESSTKVYVPITNISNTAPVVITTGFNNIPVGWRARVTGVAGMKEINCTDDQYYLVTDASSTTVTINDINATKFNTYTSGGTLEYNEPVDLNVYNSARMQIRPKIDSDIVLDTLTTENGKIIIDPEYSTISIEIPASITQNYNFTVGFYSLELVAGEEVVPFINGTVTLVKEVTR